jgi:hypothetical protein
MKGNKNEMKFLKGNLTDKIVQQVFHLPQFEKLSREIEVPVPWKEIFLLLC